MKLTEDLTWLVALLSPRDIAIHPNFASQETASAPACLALLTSSQSASLARFQDSEKWRAVEEADPDGARVVGSVRSALSVGSVESGADELRSASRSHIKQRPTLAVVCAIVASTCYAEVDRLDEANATLHEPLHALGHPRDSVTSLLAGALLANLALCEFDQGEQTSPTRAEEARAAFMSVSIDDLPGFPLSQGVAWDSATSLANVIELLLDGCAHHSASYSTDFQPRLDLVRQPSARLAQRGRGRVATGFMKHLQQELSDLFQTGGIIWAADGADGDSELCEALFTAEFSGHPSTHSYRRLLGMHRFLRGTATGEEWLIRESVRLIRQSGDTKQLTPILHAIRNHGPLTVLQADALQVLSRRRTGPLLREVELNVLRSAALLLGKDASADAIRLLLATREYQAPRTPRHWQLRSVRLGALWRTVVELARTADESAFVASTLFAEIRDAEPDDTMDHEYARAVNRLERDGWGDVELQRRIESWTGSQDAADFHRESRNAFRRVLDFAAPQLSDGVETSTDVTLTTVQRLIDRSLVHDEIAFPSSQIGPAGSLLVDRMSSVREAAARGQYSMGGVDECELAVALALLTEQTSLWTSITDFLCDARVQREDKSSALARMVRDFDRIPSLVADSLRERTANLLNGGPDFMDQRGPDPFPEGLRLSAVLGLLDSSEVLNQVGRLLGDARSNVRRHGVQVLLDLLAAAFDYPWLSTSAMLLTQDRDTEVRATAGRALTQLMSYGEVGEDVVTTRMISLLEEDGYLIPNSVLVGLIDSGMPMNSRVKRKVTAIASTHIDASARSHAIQLLDKQTS